MLLTWCFICKTVIPLKAQIKIFYKTLSISFTNTLTHCYPNASQCGTKIQLETVWDSITEKKNFDEGASKSLLWWTSQKHRFCQLLKENWIWDINILQCEKFMGLWCPKKGAGNRFLIGSIVCGQAHCATAKYPLQHSVQFLPLLLETKATGDGSQRWPCKQGLIHVWGCWTICFRSFPKL